MLGPSRPSNLNPAAKPFVPGGPRTPNPTAASPAVPGQPHPTSVAASGPAPAPTPGTSLLPGVPGYPHYDARAHTQNQSLRYLEDCPDAGFMNMWNNGTVPFFPTGERPPTSAETAMLKDFAHQINLHREASIPVPLQPQRLHRQDPLRSGEYGAMYQLDKPGSGRPLAGSSGHPADPGMAGDGVPVREKFSYNPDASVELNAGPQTRMVIHSHPIQTLQGPMTIDNLAVRMPSITDHEQASLDQMKSGADNYLVYGDRVSHFNGKDLSVTELRPSPLQGEMPAIRP